jgi:Secretion system C-terminal sorting domain
VVANNTLSNITNVGMKIYDYGLNYYVNNPDGSRTFVSFPKNYSPIVKNNIIIGPYWGFQILGAAQQRIDSVKNYALRTPYTASPSFFIPQKLSLFSDTTAYTLSATSSILDWGVDMSVQGITTDRFGTARPQGTHFDIGAHELLYSPPPVQPLVSSKSPVSTMSIYPTISDNTINVKMPPSVQTARYVVFNAQGQVVINSQYNSSKGSEFSLDIGDFQPGVYILSAVDNHTIYTAKFIKQ